MTPDNALKAKGGYLNPDQYILTKKSIEKDKIQTRALKTELCRLTQYFIIINNASCKLNIYVQGNRYINYLEIIKYLICTKSSHSNSVFCINIEFFYHFPPSRIVKSLPALKSYYSQKRPV